MPQSQTNEDRRMLLQVAAGIAAAGALGASSAQPTASKPAPATGAPGDFDFLTGSWKIANRRLVDARWDEFDSEATVISLLGGVASVEELRIPARNFSGMGLRLLDVAHKRWADYWVNSKSGILPAQPSWGTFNHGVGIWDSVEEDGGKSVIVRGVWDRITPDACRWYQAVSRDGGKSWSENWVMHWTRTSAR
ncbi:MAG TPA: hypothetical protein VGC21_18690 [Telluria sp.]